MPISNTTDRFNGVVASKAIKVRCVVGVEEQVDELDGISNPYSGINIVDGDRVLLVGQTDEIENGVWDTSAADPWTRAFDWDGNRDVEKGSTVWAGQSGGLDKLWQVQTAGVILPGSTAQQITLLFDPEASAGGQPNPIKLPEIAGADIDVPGEGQIWVRDDGPNVLMFTNDEGDDFVVNTGGGDPDRLIDPASNVAMIALGSGIVALRSVGNLEAEDRELRWQHQDGTTQFSIGSEFFTDMIFRNHITGRHMLFQVGIGGGNRTRIFISGDQADGGVLLYAGANSQKLETILEGVKIRNGTFFLQQQAAAEADIAGFGQLHVDSSDDSLHYVTEAGVDFDLTAAAGGGGVTVEDEGVPLATVANTLDFVGAGVVASGAGTTKTITIPGGVGTPAGANEQIQYNDNGAFGATSFMEYDVSQGSIILDVRNAGSGDGAFEAERLQEGATGLKLQSGNGNTTFHNIWQDFDPDFESSWRLEVDSTSPDRLLTFIDDPSTVYIQMDAFGQFGRMRFGGNAGSESVFIDFNNDIFAIRNDMTLYLEELAAANAEVALHGQIWVRDDTPNVLMFTDDAGTDFVLNAGGGAEVNDLTAAVTWANIPDANVPESAVTQHEAAIDHDALSGFVADEHIDWSVTGAEDIHADRLPAPASTFVMVTPVSISLGSDDAWETISDAALATAGATHALIKCFAQVAPTASAFATQVIHLRETGSAIAKATSNRAAIAGEEDAAALGVTTDTNDAWVELDGNQDFDILQDPTGTASHVAQAWIVGYMA